MAQIPGTVTKTIPLISFYALVDEDMGVLKYVLSNYKDSDIFDIDSLKNVTNALSITGDLYRRKYSNPLYYIMKDEKYADLLDRCYYEYLSEHEADILEYSVGTEIINLAAEFNKSSDIEPVIMYYNNDQLNALNTIEELSSIPKISIEEVLNDKKNYTCYYLNYISELDNFKNLTNTTIYLSSCGLNLNDDNTDFKLSNDDIKELMKRKIQIGIYDLYRMNLIGEYQHDN